MFESGTATDPMPIEVAVFLGLLLIVTAGILWYVGVRSTSGTLSRNHLVGIRTYATLESDEAWDAAHRAGGPWLKVAAVGPALAGIVVLLRPNNGVGLAATLIGLAWLVGWVIASGVRGSRAANAIDSPD